MKALLTAKEFAEMVGYSERTVHEKCAAGEIEFVRLGENGRIRIPWRIVRQYLGEDAA